MKFGLDENTIGKIQDVFGRFPEVEEVILYGSRAKGTHRPGSDIDLTLKGGRLNLHLLNKIRDVLYKLNTPYTFDLSIFAQIENPDVIDHIRRVGKPFFVKS